MKFERAGSDENLLQKLDLQKRKLKKYLSETEKETQGFVAAEHTFEQLQKKSMIQSLVWLLQRRFGVLW